jgi:hypothetical protein
VLAVALLVAKSCGETEAEVSKDEAIAIAKAQVDFEPSNVQIRFLRQGLKGEIWLVALIREDAQGVAVQATNVRLDADTGQVLRIEQVR